jgi:hypothetical protein
MPVLGSLLQGALHRYRSTEHMVGWESRSANAKKAHRHKERWARQGVVALGTMRNAGRITRMQRARCPTQQNRIFPS